MLWSDADEASLRKAGEVLRDQTDAVHTSMKVNSKARICLKKLGIAGFLFFLIKGLAWLFLFLSSAKTCKNKNRGRSAG